MGVVWRATDTQLPRTVALKQTRDPGNADEARRMRREARHAASLEHEHVVTLHDPVFDEDGHPWLVMEYISAPSLAELIKSERLEPRRVARLGAQIAEARPPPIASAWSGGRHDTHRRGCDRHRGLHVSRGRGRAGGVPGRGHVRTRIHAVRSRVRNPAVQNRRKPTDDHATGARTCKVVHRPYRDGRGVTRNEVVFVDVSGPPPPDQLCKSATELASTVVTALPPPRLPPPR